MPQNGTAFEVVDVAMRVRAAGDAYPPPDVADAREAFAAWLANDEYTHRWVARHQGAVVGHVAVTRAHPYLSRFLNQTSAPVPDGPVAEVGKLFVDPAARGHRVGPALLATAAAQIRTSGAVPALAVLAATPAAIRLYERVGLRSVGSFSGIHGLNHVYVLDPSQPITIPAHPQAA